MRTVEQELLGCAGVWGAGFAAARSGYIDEPTQAAASRLYARAVFPAMVFRGMASVSATEVPEAACRRRRRAR